MAIVSSGTRGTTNSSGRNRSSSLASGHMRMIYGPETTWKNGVAYPNAYWAGIEVMPVEDPNHPGKWIHPNRAGVAKAQRTRTLERQSRQTLNQQREPDTSEGMGNSGYVTPSGFARGDTGRNTKKAVSNAVSGKINSVTRGVSGEVSRIRSGGQAALDEYNRTHGGKSSKPTDYDDEPSGNAVGRAVAYAKGALGSTAAANAARNEASNIRSGAESARQAYRDSHKESLAPGVTKYTGTKMGETLAGIKGGVANSAVGRAGKAAFQALTSKIDDFKKGIDNYVTGMFASTNRKQALQKLQTKAGNLMGAISNALGTSEERSSILGAAQGTVSGIVSGIASSDIGKAAINAGKNAYGAVKNGVNKALTSIKDFFKNAVGDAKFKEKVDKDRHVSSHRVLEA